jgi:mono/diheme cytochrome c family protein
MRSSSRSAFILSAFLAAGAAAMWSSGAAAQSHDHDAQHEPGEHHHAEAAALKNPVKATPESIAAGKTIYDKQCASCHGETGKGDGKMAASITTGPKPSDLSDATWKHGSTDGEMFTLIKDGSKGTGMRAFGSRLKPEDIWNVVNYLRTLGPKTTSKSR